MALLPGIAMVAVLALPMVGVSHFDVAIKAPSCRSRRCGVHVAHRLKGARTTASKTKKPASV